MEKSAAGPGLLSQVARLPAWLAVGVGLGLAVWIGVIEAFENSFNLSLESFYLIPIALVTWAAGGVTGAFLSIFCVGMYLAAGWYAGHSFSQSSYFLIWNALLRLGIFLPFTLLVAALRSRMLAENKLRRTDSLTGALNNRGFYEEVRSELDRARRYRRPFTVVYMGLDRFKEINEAFGHSIGDAVLRTVARTITGQIRVVDVLARLGGDEFALLLPETGAPEAEAMLPRLHDVIAAEMHRGQWPTSLTIGATVFRGCPRRVDDVIYMAEHAMQKAKKSAERAFHITIFEEEAGG